MWGELNFGRRVFSTASVFSRVWRFLLFFPSQLKNELSLLAAVIKRRRTGTSSQQWSRSGSEPRQHPRGDDGDAKPVPRALGPDPGPEEPRRPRKRPQPMPISRGTTWADLRDFTHQDPSPVRPPGSRLEDISTLPATPATSPRVCEPKRKNQAGYSDICPPFPPSFSSSLPADLARMTVVWLDPAFARLALAPINPVNPSGRSLLCTYPASNGCSRCTERRGDDGERTLSAKFRSLFFFSRRSLQLENDINLFRSALPLQLPHSTQHTAHSATPVRPEQRTCSWGGIAGRS